MAEVTTRVTDPGFPRGFGNEGSLKFVRDVTAFGDEVLKTGVGFADIVPAGGGTECVGPLHGGGECCDNFVGGFQDIGGVRLNTLPRFGSSFKALAFLVVALAIARSVRSLVGGREERKWILGFFARPTEGGGVTSEGGIDQINLAGCQTIRAKRLPLAIEHVPEPDAGFIFVIELTERMQGHADEVTALGYDVFVGRFCVLDEFAPIDLHVALFAVANVASDVDVQAREVRRRVKEIDEVLAAQDMGFRKRLLGMEFFQ